MLEVLTLSLSFSILRLISLMKEITGCIMICWALFTTILWSVPDSHIRSSPRALGNNRHSENTSDLWKKTFQEAQLFSNFIANLFSSCQQPKNDRLPKVKNGALQQKIGTFSASVFGYFSGDFGGDMGPQVWGMVACSFPASTVHVRIVSWWTPDSTPI